MMHPNPIHDHTGHERVLFAGQPAGEGQPAPDAPPGSSLARLLANLDTDDNAADFGVLSLPTPGTGPVGAPVPEPRAWVLVLVGSAALRRALRGS